MTPSLQIPSFSEVKDSDDLHLLTFLSFFPFFFLVLKLGPDQIFFFFFLTEVIFISHILKHL